MREALVRGELPYDRRPLQPHLTIARPGDRLGPAELAGDLDALDAYESPPWLVDELRLVRSVLGPPHEYEILAAGPMIEGKRS